MADETLNILLRITGEDDDAAATLDSLARKLATFSGESAEAEADVQTQTADQKVKALHDSLRDIGAVDVEPKVDVTTGDSTEKIAFLRAQLQRIPDERVEVHLVTERFRAGLVAAIGALGSLKIQAAAIVATLGGAALSAAGAVAGIGAAALATVGPFGVLALAVKQRLKEGSGAVDAFKDRLEEIKVTFADALGPAADAVLRGLTRGLSRVPQLVANLGPAFTRFGRTAGGALQALGREFTSPRWEQFFRTMIDGANRAIRPLSAIISDLGRIFRNVAEAGLPIFIDLLGQAADGLRGLAEKTSDIEGLRAKMQDGVDVLGKLVDIAKNAADAVLAIFKAGDDAGFIDALENATDTVADFLASAEGQDTLKELFNAIVPLVQELADALPELIPVFASVVKVANEVFTVVLDIVQGLSKIPGIGPELAAIVTAFVAWKGPLSVASGLLGGIISKLGDIAKKRIVGSVVAEGATGAVGGAAGGAAAGAAGGAAGQSFLDRFKQKLLSLPGVIGGAITGVAGGIAARFATLGRFLMGPAGLIGGLIAATPLFIHFFIEALESAGRVARGLWGAFGDLGKFLGNATATGITAAGQGIATAAKTVANAAVTAAKSVGGAAREAGKWLGDKIKDGVRGVGSALGTAGRTVARIAVDAAKGLAGGAGSAGRTLGNAVKDGISAIGGAIGSAGRTVARGAVNAVGDFAGAAGRAGRSLGRSVGDGLAGAAGFISRAARSIATTGLRAIGDVAGGFFNIGLTLVRSLANGIRSGASEAINAAIGVAEDAWNGAKHFLGIGSPSRLFMDIGRDTVRGFAEGLRSEMAGAAGGMTAALSVQVDAARALPTTAGIAPAGMGTTVVEHHVHVDVKTLTPGDPRTQREIAHGVLDALASQPSRRNPNVRGA